MKALKVTYSRLISKGNYENAKIEIELEVQEGEKASEVFEAAKAFVEKRIAVEKMSSYTVESAQKVMQDKRNHTLAQIEEAEEILSKIQIQDDLPF
jgi:Ser-tRNA(Ala) deacylase AlaX